MKIKYIGHSCFIIEDKNIKILTDPFISDNPKVKINPLNLKPDVILLSHDHSDHFGDVIEISKSSGASVVCIYELANELNKFRIPTISGNIGGTVSFKNIAITFVKADHSCKNGVPIGFIIHLSNNIIYFAGDTGVFYDMKLIRDLYHPDIVMLPIDGVFNMGPKETSYAIKLLEPKKVIPMHYGTFPLLTGTPDQLKEEIIKENINVELIVMKINQEIIF